jgi:ubiquinone/menaquinone biosynthesis C-methylase UbiE
MLAGCDITLENLSRVKKHNVYDYICLCSAAKLPFPEDFVDTIIAIEVLEHLEKAEALNAIAEFKRVATQRVVITVPRASLDADTKRDERSFIKIESDDPDVKEYVEAERHKCAFTPSELRFAGFELGGTFNCSGIKGHLKKLRRWYRNRWGVHAGQYLGTLTLEKGEGKPQPYPTPLKWTAGFADFR